MTPDAAFKGNGVVPTYYWALRPNFGDMLSPFLLAHFGGISAVWSPPENARLVCAGSVLDVLPLKWSGIVAGSGVLHEGHRIDLRSATILGLRGKKSLELAQGDKSNVTLGDPGLLVSEIIPPVEKKHKFGVVSHWTNTDLVGRFPSGHPISAALDPISAVKEIASCERIVASSLHGIVVADAFRIPRQCEPFAPKKYEGGTFKFHDYGSGLGLPMVFGKMQSVPDELIDGRQQELFGMFEQLKQELAK